MISSTLFWVDSLGFSIYKFMSSISRDSSMSFFPIWMLFISFYCLIALTRTFSSMLNRSGESGHPCLVPNIRGKAFSLLPLSMILAVGFTHCLAHTWPCVLSHFICVQLFVTPWTVACQTSLSIILQARTLEWVAVPFSRGSSDPGIEPASLTSPVLAGGFFTISATLSSLWVLSSNYYSYKFPFHLGVLSFIYFPVCSKRECFSLCSFSHLDLEGLSYFYHGKENTL